jgi:hypothetical protein
MDILSTLKSEYSRTVILIVIPGAIALEPYSIILYQYFNLTITGLSEIFIYTAVVYLFASLFSGFILQDLGARLEVFLEKIYCKRNRVNHDNYIKVFEVYLFNLREENYIVTHYYRSMLIRTKFELHSISAIIFLWIGMILRVFLDSNLNLDNQRTFIFAIFSFTIFAYIVIEAYKGIQTLHYYRELINEKFHPTIT